MIPQFIILFNKVKKRQRRNRSLDGNYNSRIMGYNNTKMLECIVLTIDLDMMLENILNNYTVQPKQRVCRFLCNRHKETWKKLMQI